MSRTVLCAALAAAVVTAVAWAADAPATKSPQEIADAREATMKRLAGAVKVASKPETERSAAKAKVAEAIQIAESIPSLFPKGTGIGDKGITHSRALQDVWAKPEDFKTKAANLVTALKAADAALDTGDQTKITAAFNGGVYAACKGCHDAFRGPEIE